MNIEKSAQLLKRPGAEWIRRILNGTNNKFKTNYEETFF